jgi:hypothetical protein
MVSVNSRQTVELQDVSAKAYALAREAYAVYLRGREYLSWPSVVAMQEAAAAAYRSAALARDANTQKMRERART